jgi:beta-phosphoglucomutase family hydrolase
MSQYCFKAGIFDMDGVITKTAIVHADAWKMVFDEYLRILEKRDDKPFQEFTHQDYLNYVDGKPRLKGIASFLESRGITLSLGSEKDTLEDETIYAIGNTKNKKFRNVLETKGVQLYEPTVKLIKQLKSGGLKVAVVSSSKNCKFVLEAAEVLHLFDTRVDGVIAKDLGLEGKPEGDIFVKAAYDLGTTPAESIVFEDAISGVQSGRNGGFGLVVGIARSDNIKDLIENGADIAVTSVSMIDLDKIQKWFMKKPGLIGSGAQAQQAEDAFKPEAGKLEINPVYLNSFEQIYSREKQKIIFISRSCMLEGQTEDILKDLAEHNIIVVYDHKPCMQISEITGAKNIHYLGSDGFTIYGEGSPVALFPDQEIAKDPGETVRWFIKTGDLDWNEAQVIYIGAGIEAESAFRKVNTRGVSILISEKEVVSSANYRISSARDLEKILKK